MKYFDEIEVLVGVDLAGQPFLILVPGDWEDAFDDTSDFEDNNVSGWPENTPPGVYRAILQPWWDGPDEDGDRGFCVKRIERVEVAGV